MEKIILAASERHFKNNAIISPHGCTKGKSYLTYLISHLYAHRGIHTHRHAHTQIGVHTQSHTHRHNHTPEFAGTQRVTHMCALTKRCVHTHIQRIPCGDTSTATPQCQHVCTDIQAHMLTHRHAPSTHLFTTGLRARSYTEVYPHKSTYAHTAVKTQQS